MEEVKVVPWYNADEFRKVYERVFPPEVEQMNWAIDKISVWKTRVYPSLPAAIECTYLFTSTLTQDLFSIADKMSIFRQYAIELQYCCAIVRFVNLTVAEREKEYSPNEKPPVIQIAKLIGIPPFIVDLRNQISHSTQTPPLPHLRLAAKAALNYLKKWYWDIEAPRVRNAIMKCPEKKKFRDALEAYLSARFGLFYLENKIEYDEQKMDVESDEDDVIESVGPLFHDGHGKKRKWHMEYSDEETNEEREAREEHKKEMARTRQEAEEKKNMLESELIKSLKVIEKLLDENKKTFVDVYVEECFIPPDNELHLFCDSETCEAFTEASDHNCPNSPPTDRCIPNVPQLHEDLHLPIIRIMNNKGAVSLFLEKLLLSQGSRTVVGQKLIVAWVIKLMKTQHSLCVKDPQIEKIFKKRGIIVNYERLLMSALINPCKYIHLVMPWLYLNCTIDKRCLDRLMQLFAIYLGYGVDENTMPQPEKFFTLEDLKKAKRAQEEKLMSLNEEVRKCMVNIGTDSRIVNKPLGYVIPGEKKLMVEVEDCSETANKVKEEDISETDSESKDFKMEYIISDPEAEDFDLDEYYSQFSDSRNNERFNEFMEELNKKESLLYQM